MIELFVLLLCIPAPPVVDGHHRVEYLSPYTAAEQMGEILNLPAPPQPQPQEPHLQEFLSEDQRIGTDTLAHGGRSHYRRQRQSHHRPARQLYRGDFEPMVFKTLAVLDSSSSVTVERAARRSSRRRVSFFSWQV